LGASRGAISLLGGAGGADPPQELQPPQPDPCQQEPQLEPELVHVLHVPQADRCPQPHPALQLVAQQDECEQQRCRLPNAIAESAMTNHTVSNTANNMTILRMTLPPRQTG
jgi:hypothetical protein